MIRPLLVAVSHGLDLITFMFAIVFFGISIEGEINPLMRDVYASAGLAGVALLKGAGAAALSFIAAMRHWALLPAAVPGILGACVNTLAIAVTR